MKIMFNYQETEGVTIDDYLIQDRDASFMLRVKGDSMVDSGIYDGDMVIVERGKEPKSGNIVVVVSEGDFKMEHYPLKSSEQVTIEAVVIAVVRKMVS